MQHYKLAENEACKTKILTEIWSSVFLNYSALVHAMTAIYIMQPGSVFLLYRILQSKCDWALNYYLLCQKLLTRELFQIATRVLHF